MHIHQQRVSHCDIRLTQLLHMAEYIIVQIEFESQMVYLRYWQPVCESRQGSLGNFSITEV